MTTESIDLTKLDGKAFVGRSNGAAARTNLHVEDKEQGADSIDVIFPENMMSMSSSFILGLFSKSIMNFDSKEDFYQKYHFRNADKFKSKIDDAVMHALIGKRRSQSIG